MFKVIINKINKVKIVETVERAEVGHAVKFIRFHFQQNDVESVGIFHGDGKPFCYANKKTGTTVNW